MKTSYKDLLPKWFEEQTNNDLVLSNDLDSLVSCAILSKVKDWKIRYFYDFNNLYMSDKIEEKKDKRVWVDVACLNGEKTFDNHISMVSLDDVGNNNTINPNNMCMITNENYIDKYSGSTALLLWSLYDLPLPETEEGKMLLLTIDSTYYGFWNPKYKDKFRARNKFFLCEVFDMEELYKVQERHTYEEFEDVKIKYGIKESIYLEDGKLRTGLDIDLIGEALGIELNVVEDDVFILRTKYKTIEYKIFIEKKVSDISDDIFSLAFTYRNSVRFSKEIPKERKWKIDF